MKPPTSIATKRHAGFTLIELLIVMSLAILLSAMTVPSLREMLNSINLSGAGDFVQDEFSLARQTATSRNMPVEVRIYKTDDGTGSGYRTFVLLIPALASGKAADEWLTPARNLPGHMIADITAGQNYSTLLTATTAPPDSTNPQVQGPWAATETANAPARVKNLPYVGFRFQPDGTTNLPKDAPWCLTLKSAASATGSTAQAAPAKNYVTVVLDSLTGHTLLFRP